MQEVFEVWGWRRMERVGTCLHDKCQSPSELANAPGALAWVKKTLNPTCTYCGSTHPDKLPAVVMVGPTPLLPGGYPLCCQLSGREWSQSKKKNPASDPPPPTPPPFCMCVWSLSNTTTAKTWVGDGRKSSTHM